MATEKRAKRPHPRGQRAKTQSSERLAEVINETLRLRRKHHLEYDQTKYVVERARRRLALAQELRTHLRQRPHGYLFENNRHTRYAVRTVQSIVGDCARAAGINKRVFPHLLRHSVATIWLDSGQVPIDQVQKFLGHMHLSTTQIYAETSLRALGENYGRALGGTRL